MPPVRPLYDGEDPVRLNGQGTVRFYAVSGVLCRGVPNRLLPPLLCRERRDRLVHTPSPSDTVAWSASSRVHEAITAACRCTTSGGVAFVPPTIARERGAKPTTAATTNR
jgi:hypothetical protein